MTINGRTYRIYRSAFGWYWQRKCVVTRDFGGVAFSVAEWTQPAGPHDCYEDATEDVELDAEEGAE